MSDENEAPLMCPEFCDDIYKLCWNATLAGHNTSNSCPERLVLLSSVGPSARAVKYCGLDGNWVNFNGTSVNATNATSHGYTDYTSCMLSDMVKLTKMCQNFGSEKCMDIAKLTRMIEIVGLSVSLICLLISLIIFFQYRVLINNRTKIHKNFFIATLVHIVFRLIKYIDQSIESQPISHMEYLNNFTIVGLEYGKTAMVMWMFIEGLYLHNMITIALFQEYNYLKIYFIIGWSVPALLLLVWIIIMIFNINLWNQYFFFNYYWILEGPRYFAITINILFLLNIIRVLVVKLRESHTSEIEQIRKAVRAAIFLVPLLGITNILFLALTKPFNELWKFQLWMIVAYFFNSFEGFFVAVIYCFLNGEVQTAIKNSFYLHMSLRNYDYSTCRNATFVSAAVDEEINSMNKSEIRKWVPCCKEVVESPEEKEIDICDLDHQNTENHTNSLTMAETKLITASNSYDDSTWKHYPLEEKDIVEDKSTN